jgi:LPS-assembly lipoprotein
MHRPQLKIVLLACLFAILAGCGFHPRNTLALADQLGPVKVVTADPYSPLAYGLATALDRAGATAAVEGQPSATLNVRSERMENRPLSVDRQAQVREYESRFIVKFELLDADGGTLVPLQEIALTREYTYDALSPGGSPAEQELLRTELRRDMQAAILRRIDVVLRNK